MRDLLSEFPLESFPDIAARLADVATAKAALAEVNGLAFWEDGEIIAQRERIREDNSDFLDHILFVAVDSGGILYGLWIRGRMSGMWTLLDHHEIDISPAWRNTADFISAVKLGGWSPRPTLPDVEQAASADELASWASAREAYFKNFELEYANDAEGMFTMFWGYTVIALTPVAEAASLMRFLTIDNQWVAERAANTLGDFGYKPAIAALQELASKGGNGALAAKGALKKLGEA